MSLVNPSKYNREFRVYGFFKHQQSIVFLTQKHIHPSPEIEAFFSSEFGVWVGVGSKSHWIIDQKIEIMLDIIGAFWAGKRLS